MESNVRLKNILQNGLKTIRENLLVFIFIGVVAAVFNFLPTIAQNWVDISVLPVLVSLVIFLVVLFYDAFIHLKHYNLSFAMHETVPSTIDITQRLKSRALTLIGVSLVYFVLVFLGFLAFILPGLYLMVRLYPVFAVCMIEDNTSVIDSFKDTWSRTSGHQLTLFGLFGVLLLIQVAVTVILGIGFVVTSLVSMAVSVVVLGSISLLSYLIMNLILEAAIADFVVLTSETER